MCPNWKQPRGIRVFWPHFEVPNQVVTDEMAEMEEMVQKGTEGNQAKWDLRGLLE